MAALSSNKPCANAWTLLYVQLHILSFLFLLHENATLPHSPSPEEEKRPTKLTTEISETATKAQIRHQLPSLPPLSQHSRFQEAKRKSRLGHDKELGSNQVGKVALHSNHLHLYIHHGRQRYHRCIMHPKDRAGKRRYGLITLSCEIQCTSKSWVTSSKSSLTNKTGE